MATWKSEIAVKHLLGGDNNAPADIARIAGEVHTVLMRLPECRAVQRAYTDGGDVDPVAEELFEIADEFHTISLEPDTATVTEFDAVLEGLYDWADAQRVWVA